MRGPEALALLGIFATAGVTIISVARAYYRHLETRDRLHALPTDLEDRIGRIEQAVDAIAIEVERMSEGQRFTTKLLADRLGDATALPRGPASMGHSS
jgi:hypothetical protein